MDRSNDLRRRSDPKGKGKGTQDKVTEMSIIEDLTKESKTRS